MDAPPSAGNPVLGAAFAVPAALVWWVGLLALAPHGVLAAAAWALVLGPLAALVLLATEAVLVGALRSTRTRGLVPR